MVSFVDVRKDTESKSRETLKRHVETSELILDGFYLFFFFRSTGGAGRLARLPAQRDSDRDGECWSLISCSLLIWVVPVCHIKERSKRIAEFFGWKSDVSPFIFDYGSRIVNVICPLPIRNINWMWPQPANLYFIFIIIVIPVRLHGLKLAVLS